MAAGLHDTIASMSLARTESNAYWICFVAAFLAVAAWESLQPKRELTGPAGRRWRNHGALLVVGAVISALLIRVSPVVLAVMVANSRFGLLNKTWMPWLLRCALAVVLLDLLQYWIHWGFHHFPWLWRVHQVHHSDPDYDVSTAARFHPVELLWSTGIHLGGVALLAPPPEAVVVAGLVTVILNFSAHANASFPDWTEKIVRRAFITPDLHRIHHFFRYARAAREPGADVFLVGPGFRDVCPCGIGGGGRFQDGIVRTRRAGQPGDWLYADGTVRKTRGSRSSSGSPCLNRNLRFLLPRPQYQQAAGDQA